MVNRVRNVSAIVSYFGCTVFRQPVVVVSPLKKKSKPSPTKTPPKITGKKLSPEGNKDRHAKQEQEGRIPERKASAAGEATLASSNTAKTKPSGDKSGRGKDEVKIQSQVDDGQNCSKAMQVDNSYSHRTTPDTLSESTASSSQDGRTRERMSTESLKLCISVSDKESEDEMSDSKSLDIQEISSTDSEEESSEDSEIVEISDSQLMQIGRYLGAQALGRNQDALLSQHMVSAKLRDRIVDLKARIGTLRDLHKKELEKQVSI